MVLLSQAELSDGEMDKAILIRLKPVPLDQDIESGHGEGQTSLEIEPRPMTDLLEMTNDGQHRQDGFDHHTYIPGAARADFHVGRVACFGMEAGIGQDDHLLTKLGYQGLEGRVMHIGRVTAPSDDQAELVQDKAELAADDPTPVRFALLADLFRATPFAHRVQQFNAIAVGHAQKGWLGQKAVGPSPMRLEQPEQARPIWQVRRKSATQSRFSQR